VGENAHVLWSKSAVHVVTVGICSHCFTKLLPGQPSIILGFSLNDAERCSLFFSCLYTKLPLKQPISAVQETEPLDIIIVRRGQRSTGEAFVLLRMPIQVELVLRKNKTYIGKRYVEVTLAKKLVSSLPLMTWVQHLVPLMQQLHLDVYSTHRQIVCRQNMLRSYRL
jgi:hypothetical protein